MQIVLFPALIADSSFMTLWLVRNFDKTGSGALIWDFIYLHFQKFKRTAHLMVNTYVLWSMSYLSCIRLSMCLFVSHNERSFCMCDIVMYFYPLDDLKLSILVILYMNLSQNVCFKWCHWQRMAKKCTWVDIGKHKMLLISS